MFINFKLTSFYSQINTMNSAPEHRAVLKAHARGAVGMSAPARGSAAISAKHKWGAFCGEMDVCGMSCLCGLSGGTAALNEHLFGSASGMAMRVPLFPALRPRMETGVNRGLMWIAAFLFKLCQCINAVCWSPRYRLAGRGDRGAGG